MANVAKTIEIIFAGTDNMSGTLSSIGSNLETFGTDLQDIGAPFADAAKKALMFEAALIAMSIGGIALATTKAGEFSASMAEINTLLDISGNEFQSYSAGVVEYSLTSTASLSDLQLALYNLISLGGDYATSLEALSVIEKLSVATKTDMTSTTETLIGTMNAYGAGIDQAADYSDAFFTIIQDGKTTLPELSTSIAQVTGIAATAGINFETLGATIAAMTAAGAPTSQAITSIKAAIQALVAPTKLTSEAAKNLGIELGQSAIKSQGFEVVLKQIYDAANGDIEIMKTMIPSIEGLSAASILGADSAGILAKALNDMGKNTGATEKAFEKMKDNLNLSWQTMLNNWDAIWILFGLGFEKESNLLIKAVTNLFGAIANSFNAGDFDIIIEFIKNFVIDLTESINSISENLSKSIKGVDFTRMIASFNLVVETIKNLFNDMDIDITTIEGLEDVINKTINVITILQGVVSGIVEAFKPLISAMVQIAEKFSETDDNAAELIGKIIGFGSQLVILGGILAIGGGMLSGIGALLSSFGKLGLLFKGGGVLSTGITGIISKFSLLLQNPFFSGTVAFTGGYAIGTALRDLFPSIDTVTQKMFRAIDSVVNFTGQKGNVNLEGNFNKIGTALDSIPNEKDVDINADFDDVDFEAIKNKILEIEKDIVVDVTAEANISAVKEELSWFDEDGKEHIILIDVETKNLEETKEKIEEIPTEKMLEIKLQGDIDLELQNIISQAETVQRYMEWEAKVDIAEIEAAALTIQAAFESAGVAIMATSEAAGSMFGDLLSGIGDLSSMDQWFFQDILKDQMELQEKAIDSQIKLTEAQIKLMDAKTEALESGDSLITINSNGLEPALEMIMWEILEKVQIKASGESADFLLGL